MPYEKNKELLKLITSTGLLAVTETNIFLFYDRHSGFFSNPESCLFFNNLHQNLQKQEIVHVYHFFYYYPLIKKQLSLSKFFRECISEFNLRNFEEHPYYPFLWEIGIFRLNDFQENEDDKILQEMRKIHGAKFIPESTD